MNSENQIWSLIWSSLREVSLQGSQRQEVSSGERRKTLFEGWQRGNFIKFFGFILVVVNLHFFFKKAAWIHSMNTHKKSANIDSFQSKSSCKLTYQIIDIKVQIGGESFASTLILLAWLHAAVCSSVRAETCVFVPCPSLPSSGECWSLNVFIPVKDLKCCTSDPNDRIRLLNCS